MAASRFPGIDSAAQVYAAGARATQAAFTLLELLVVLLIIALLAGYVGNSPRDPRLLRCQPGRAVSERP
ncbi:prepilin-type N-terminal cleavage/methylation domain-containing protein [Cupriavidus necator]